MIVGSGWSGHFNKTIAEVTYANIQRVGMPQWDEADQALARGLQRELGSRQSGLSTAVEFTLQGPVPESQRMGGGSDDIGDVSWNVPTVTLRFPSNIPGLPGHNWSSSIASATPIAHKGAVSGAKVQALTLLDILMRPQVVADAWTYFREVQTRETQYQPFISPTDQPPTWMNADIMARYKADLQRNYYDPKKYKTYLEQLGIRYPTVREAPRPNMDNDQ
jgi:aminobenzoyl-glutamate utilization protein B